MPEKRATYRRKVNFYETDAQGVVHHSNYLRYFEEARGFLLEILGYPYSKMHMDGFHVVLVEAQMRLKHPLVYQDEFEIDTHIYIENDYSFCFDYKVYRQDKLCARAHTKHSILKASKLIKIPEFLIKLIND